MSSDPISRILALLPDARRAGDGWVARCPAHQDAMASLSICEGEDGRVLVHCFAGCSTEQIVAACGLSVRDLFSTPNWPPSSAGRRTVLTVETLARSKCLSPDFLRSLGLRDVDRGVLIPYLGAEGGPLPRQRLRTTLKAREGSRWLAGDGPIVPYGVDRLADSRKNGNLLLVEGESDCWVCWLHEIPALGIPGAAMTKCLQASHLAGFSRLYVVREPDAGGDTFVRGVQSQLRKIGWSGEVLEVRLEGAKDACELYEQSPAAFRETFLSSIERGVPLTSEEAPPCPEDAGERDWIESLLLESGVSLLSANASLPAVEQALRNLAERAIPLDPLQHQMLREAALRRLEGCGIRAGARTYDAALKAKSALDGTDPNQGRSLTLSPPEPWPEPVDGAVLLDEIVSTLQRFVALPEGAAEAQALWAVHSYALDAAFASPLLALVSPEKRCGKTTNLEVLAALVRCPLPASNITPAALFRTIEKYRPTLLIDEADTFLAARDELRGVLNSGHTRTTAQIVRTVGDAHEPRIFSTWSAKAIALIGNLPGTLEDRAIVVALRRRVAGEAVDRLRRDRLNDQLAELRRRIARWALDHGEELRTADPDVPDSLHDRAQDNWRPLLAIADLVGGEWPDRARRAALALAGGPGTGEDSARTMLLADLRALFRERGTDFLTSEDVIHALLELEERPWADWDKGRPLSKKKVAQMLRPFGIRSKTRRIGSATPRCYSACDFVEAFARYLPPEPPHPPQSAPDNDFGGTCNRNREARVSLDDVGEKPRHWGDVAGVSVADPGEGADDVLTDAAEGTTATESAPGANLERDRVNPPVLGAESSEDRLSVSDPSASPPPQCPSCHGFSFWKHRDGRSICARCHPPTDPLRAPDSPDDGATGASR